MEKEKEEEKTEKGEEEEEEEKKEEEWEKEENFSPRSPRIIRYQITFFIAFISAHRCILGNIFLRGGLLLMLVHIQIRFNRFLPCSYGLIWRTKRTSSCKSYDEFDKN